MIRRQFLAGGGGVLAAAALPAIPAPAQATDDRLSAFAAANPFHGLVMTARAGVPLQGRCIGLANIEEGRPVRLDTPFAIGSISKWLTATTLLRLSDQGRIAIDAPISTYLPYFRADVGSRVTLRHLLCNASGIPNGFTPAIKADPSLRSQPLSTEDGIRRFCQGDLAFQPLEKFDYALTNWMILVGVVEQVTGQPFQQAVKRLTLDALGLPHTGADSTFADAPETAVSYATINPPSRRTEPRLPLLAASGGYISTAPDLLRAAHAVFDTGFLSPSARNDLLTVQIEDYALGGRIKMLRIDGQPRRFAWETGRVLGYRSVLAHRLDNAETLVILNNTDLSQKALDDLAIDLLGGTRIG